MKIGKATKCYLDAHSTKLTFSSLCVFSRPKILPSRTQLSHSYASMGQSRKCVLTPP